MSGDAFERYVARLTANPGIARGSIVYTTDSFRGPEGTRAGYIGGLADRIRGVITTFLLAVVTNRIFIVDWRRPCTLEPALRPARWDWRPGTWRDPSERPDAILLLPMIGRCSELEGWDAAAIEERLLRGVKLVEVNMNGFSWDLAAQLFPEASAPETFKRAFETLFDFHVPRPFEPLWTQIDGHKRAGGTLIGVHLRTGAGNGWEDPVLADWRRHRDILHFAFAEAAKRGHENPVFYFASDSAQAKDAVRNTDWGRRVLSSDFPVAHVDRSLGMGREPFDHAIVEFMILRSCDLVIGAQGGFWSGAALAGGREALAYEMTVGPRAS
jgi:hypothetical protein